MMTGSFSKAGVNQGRLPEGGHSRQSLEGTKGQVTLEAKLRA